MAFADDGYPVTTDIQVAWGEMDALNHVNNVVYFRYFETARIDYFQRMSMMDSISGNGVGPVLAETRARYRRPVTFPDTLTVASRVSEIDEHGFTMQYRIFSQAQQAVTTEGEARVVIFDFQDNKKARLPERLKAAIRALEQSGGD